MRIESVTPKRPRRVLSPHLQIYRLPLTAFLSISHRVSGAMLVVGFILANFLLAVAATHPPLFEVITLGLNQPLGKFVIVTWLLLFNVHLVHGVRHLCWDLSLGFSRHRQNQLAVTEILSALILTALMALTPCWIEAGGTP